MRPVGATSRRSSVLRRVHRIRSGRGRVGVTSRPSSGLRRAHRIRSGRGRIGVTSRSSHQVGAGSRRGYVALIHQIGAGSRRDYVAPRPVGATSRPSSGLRRAHRIRSGRGRVGVTSRPRRGCVASYRGYVAVYRGYVAHPTGNPLFSLRFLTRDCSLPSFYLSSTAWACGQISLEVSIRELWESLHGR